MCWMLLYAVLQGGWDGSGRGYKGVGLQPETLADWLDSKTSKITHLGAVGGPKWNFGGDSQLIVPMYLPFLKNAKRVFSAYRSDTGAS
eukprot:74244-Pelagomonas_calceolata.AAC.8